MSASRHAVQQVIRAARRAGLVFQHPTGKGHPRLVDPRTGRFVVISNTPRSDGAIHCIRRDCRRILGVTI